MKAGARSARLCALAVATVALGAAGPATAKAAQAPEGFFGVIPATGSSAELNTMAANGVETVRINVNWALIEPTPGTRNWSAYDAQVGGLASAGLRPAPMLLGVPQWIASYAARPPIYKGRQRTAWSSFVTELAARYGPNGTFWRDNPLIPPLPVVDWEVWNEPNLSGYWGGRPSPRRYVGLLKLTGAAIQRADPSARIGIGGIFPPPQNRYGVSMRSFVQRLYRVPGARGAFDALSIHPYAARPKQAVAYVREARRLMNRNGDRKTPIWITELGWSTGGRNWRRSPFRAKEGTQAKYLRTSFRRLLRERRRLRLRRLIWHAWQDSTVAGVPWTMKMGLLRADGSPKPSLRAYRRIAR